MNSNFRENLRNELDFQGILVKELSDKTKINKSTIESYLKTKAAEPTVENAVKIARALNVTVEYLVIGDEPKSGNHRRPLSREAQELIRLTETLSAKQCKAIINLIGELKS